MPRIADLVEPNNLRPLFSAYGVAKEVVQDLRDDLSFARALWRGLGPLRHRAPDSEESVFSPPPPLAVPALARRRIAVVASGGSGATASLVGIQRAFEDA